MHIWTISLFDPTPYDKVGELRFIQIAKTAVRLGHQVTHFTSTFRHTQKKHRFDESTVLNIEHGYKVEYIRSQGYEKNISIKRIFAHRDFAKKLVEYIEGRSKPDIIFISMPPLDSADRIVKWANKHNIPVVTDIIDPWPDSFIKDVPSILKPLSRYLLFTFYLKLKRILKNSTAVTSISNGYLNWARMNCNEISNMKCFYPALDLKEIQSNLDEVKKTEIRNSDQLRIIYVGSLGSSYDIPAIVKAAELMEKRYPGQTEFVIAGSGPQSEMVEMFEKKLNNLRYLGWISDEELIRQYYLSDLGLIQHKNNLTQTVTYKLFSYLSAGLPILNSLQSEMADIINKYDVGLNNDNGDYKELAENIEVFLNDRNKLAECKRNAIQLTREKGDSTVVYGEMINLFSDIIESDKVESFN